VTRAAKPAHFAVKEAVFPFARFSAADTLLGPEMRSTGEVMGIDADAGVAFAKAQEAAGNRLPKEGFVFVSVRDTDKPALVDVARRLTKLGFHLVATRGTAAHLASHGITAEVANKVHEGSPHIADRLKAGGITFVLNTTAGAAAVADSHAIRRATLLAGVAYSTTMEGARATVEAMEALARRPAGVRSIQEFHPRA
jgi:carbamoyl-phosphate synthase large subunit